jgi:hypothetical protein
VEKLPEDTPPIFSNTTFDYISILDACVHLKVGILQQPPHAAILFPGPLAIVLSRRKMKKK